MGLLERGLSRILQRVRERALGRRHGHHSEAHLAAGASFSGSCSKAAVPCWTSSLPYASSSFTKNDILRLAAFFGFLVGEKAQLELPSSLEGPRT